MLNTGLLRLTRKHNRIINHCSKESIMNNNFNHYFGAGENKDNSSFMAEMHRLSLTTQLLIIYDNLKPNCKNKG